MVNADTFEHQVDYAYNALLASVVSSGPFETGTHRAYAVQGLLETPEQLLNLCWCILGFLDEVGEVDFKLKSIIGSGELASTNLRQDLATYFDIGVEPPPNQASKDRKRNPLIAEIISHVLVHIQRRKNIFPEWIGDVVGCRNPHLSVNDGGLDVIALGCLNTKFLPVLGEVKAYENDPSVGFNKGCEKFSQIRNGIYNHEIRRALSILSVPQGLNNNDLAHAIWETNSNFGVFVNYDQSAKFDIKEPINRAEVKKQPIDRLFLLIIPYEKMEALFDTISENLLALANSLGK